ncbi:MAG: T9SS type A sorting domain-containing protein [Bacteroidales bacterium]|nr:T9SS type A sorting domain-containing protein [Bacteroidales bacterium]
MPLCFKAHENGEYTLTISITPHSSLLTPHLIDNMTGADIDLLSTPSYTFTAKTTDYASRFKLVFNGNSAEGNDDFAFIDAAGNLIVTGTGLLQVFDVLGHQLYAKQLPTPNSSLLTPNFPGGVYVLRLNNRDNCNR